MRRVIGVAAALALLLPGPTIAQDQDTIKVGILVALEGSFAAGGADGVRNVELALKKVGYRGFTSIFMHPVPRGVPIRESTAKVSEEINQVREGYLAKCLARVG